MKNLLSFSLAVLGMVLVLSLTANPAQAQASRTWVSGTGDDMAACSRTAPCKTFAAAIAVTTAGGQINCLDPAGFGSLTINKSITIDCHEAFASVLVSGTNGININFDAIADSFKMVNLRNLGIDGSGASGTGISITGDGTGSFVSIEDCLINHFAGGGIVDGRKTGALTISNTTVKNNSGVGISMASAGNALLYEMLTNVRVDNANYGVIAGVGARVQISRSVVTNNATAGVYVANTVMNVDSSVIMHNGVGVINNTGFVRLSNNDLAFNSNDIGGTTPPVASYGNNRFSSNGSVGVAPIGTTSNPTGQQ